MKKIRVLGIITAGVTLFALGAIFAVILLGGLGGENPGTNLSEGELTVLTPKGEEAYKWQQNPAEGRKVTVKTSAGDFSFRLWDCEAGDIFSANLAAYSGSSFSTVGDGFIQTNTKSEGFFAEKTELFPLEGAVGFVTENGEAGLSLVILTEENSLSFGENLVLFGQVTEGFDTIEAIIATGEGGYRVKEPVEILGING